MELKSPPPLPSPLWLAAVAVPMDWGWSKNCTYVPRGGSYGRRLSPGAKARRALLAGVLRAELTRRRRRLAADVVVWLRLHVELPDHTGDAINVVDLVADGVQRGSDVNDRWCALYGLSWEIQPKDPKIFIWVGQVPPSPPTQ